MTIHSERNVGRLKSAIRLMDEARNALYEVEMSILDQKAWDLIMETQTELEERAEALEKVLRS